MLMLISVPFKWRYFCCCWRLGWRRSSKKRKKTNGNRLRRWCAYHFAIIHNAHILCALYIQRQCHRNKFFRNMGYWMSYLDDNNNVHFICRTNLTACNIHHIVDVVVVAAGAAFFSHPIWMRCLVKRDDNIFLWIMAVSHWSILSHPPPINSSPPPPIQPLPKRPCFNRPLLSLSPNNNFIEFPSSVREITSETAKN